MQVRWASLPTPEWTFSASTSISGSSERRKVEKKLKWNLLLLLSFLFPRWRLKMCNKHHYNGLGVLISPPHCLKNGPLTRCAKSPHLYRTSCLKAEEKRGRVFAKFVSPQSPMGFVSLSFSFLPPNPPPATWLPGEGKRGGGNWQEGVSPATAHMLRMERPRSNIEKTLETLLRQNSILEWLMLHFCNKNFPFLFLTQPVAESNTIFPFFSPIPGCLSCLKTLFQGSFWLSQRKEKAKKPSKTRNFYDQITKKDFCISPKWTLGSLLSNDDSWNAKKYEHFFLAHLKMNETISRWLDHQSQWPSIREQAKSQEQSPQFAINAGLFIICSVQGCHSHSTFNLATSKVGAFFNFRSTLATLTWNSRSESP